MDLTEKQQEEFSELAIPMMKFLSDNSLNETTVVIDQLNAKLLSTQVGVEAVKEYLN